MLKLCISVQKGTFVWLMPGSRLVTCFLLKAFQNAVCSNKRPPLQFGFIPAQTCCVLITKRGCKKAAVAVLVHTCPYMWLLSFRGGRQPCLDDLHILVDIRLNILSCLYTRKHPLLMVCTRS
jgi:hypothetical protein